MKFRFIGHAPLPQCFGFDWLPGAEHDITDAHAIRKLGNNPLFAAVVPGMKELSPAEAGEAKAMAQRFAPASSSTVTYTNADVAAAIPTENVTPIRKPRAKKAAG